MKVKSILFIQSIIFMTLIIVSVQNSFAQKQPPSAEEMSNREVARLKKDLTLTDDQETKVKPIVLKYEEKKQKLRSEKKSDFEASHTQMEELEKQKNEELKGVLTSEQYQKLQDMKSHMRNGPKINNK